MKIGLINWNDRMYQVKYLSAIQWFIWPWALTDNCLIQYESSSVLNGTLSRIYFSWKMKQ